MSSLNNLILSSADGRIEEVKRLVDTRAVSLDVQDQNGDTALGWACWKGEAEVVEYLISKNADINHTNRFEDTPLTQAALQGYTGICQMLLDSRADLEHVNGNGDTPLSLAAFRGHHETLELLLQRGGNYDHEDKYGKTPYEWTQHYRYDDCSMLLDDAGAKKFDTHNV